MKIKKIHVVAGAFIVIFLIVILLYIYEPLWNNFYIIGDSIVSILSFFAAISGFYAYRMHGFKSTQGKALCFISLGALFWFLGEFTWTIYEVVLGIEKPIASIADIFWFIGYPLFLIGVYYVYKAASTFPSKRKLTFLIIIIILICALLLCLAMPNLTAAEIAFEEKIATGGYVICDMLLLIGLIFVIACLFQSKFLRAWSIILIAILFSTAADVFYMNLSVVYETGNIIDLLWDLDYTLFAFGFFYYRETVEEIFTVSKERKIHQKTIPGQKTSKKVKI